MKLDWKGVLWRVAGGDAGCPACGADGLLVRPRDDSDALPDLRGVPYCECPACGARGDLFELVAKAAGSPLRETMRTLVATGELDASPRAVEAYLSRKADQALVAAHMDRCVARLRAAPHMCGIRAGLSLSNVRQLPPDTGMYVRADAPRQFAILDVQRYSQVPMTVYRYSFDGETSCVDVQNPKTLLREHRIRITGDVGTYLGDFREGEVPKAVLATHNPRSAGQIYGAMRAESSLTPPVMAVAGFPLPERFAALRILYLLDAPDSPLPVEFAVMAMGSKAVYGSDARPEMRVLSPSCPASDITASDVRMLAGAQARGKSLANWLAARLLAKADRIDEVSCALLRAGASENTRAEIAALLGADAPKALVDAVMLPAAEPDDVFTLGNGRMFKSTPVGIFAARRGSRAGEILSGQTLSNVGIAVDSRVVERGVETACCTVTHPDADVPPVQARIPRPHWGSPDAMAEDIRAAYAELGRTPYVAMYRAGGYCWADMMQFLGAHCPVQSGLQTLGATPDGFVNLPAFSARRGTVSAQTRAGSVPENALQAYSALPNAKAGLDGIQGVLAGKASLDAVGVAAGLLHALACTTGSPFDRSGVRRRPAHLLYVETEPGVWDSTLRALAYAFSGSEYVPPMDYGDRAGFLQGWAGLGTLPLLARLPSSDDMAAVLASSPVPVIAVADPLTAMACSGRGEISFALPNVEAAGDAPSVETVREALSAALAEKAGTNWLAAGHGGATALSTPCLAALGALTEERDAGTVAGGLYRSMRGRYPGAGMTGARAFFAVLHRAYMAQQRGDEPDVCMTFVAGMPSEVLRGSFNDRGEHVFVTSEHVFVGRAVVQLVNASKAYLFDAEQLSREFEESGILCTGPARRLGIDERRVWTFTRAVWDAEVVAAAGFAQKEKRQ